MIRQSWTFALTLLAIVANPVTETSETAKAADPRIDFSSIRGESWSDTLANYIASDKGCNNFAEGNWCVVRTANLFRDTWLPKEQYPPGAWGMAGPIGSIDNWCDWAFDDDEGRLFFHCGGHSSSGDTAIYAFDIRQLEWGRLTDPAPLDVPTGDVDEDGILSSCPVPHPKNGPGASHTYGGLTYVDGFIYILGSGPFCAYGDGSGQALRFGDPARKAEYEKAGLSFEEESGLVRDEKGNVVFDEKWTTAVGWRFHVETRVWEHFPTPNSTQGSSVRIDDRLLMFPTNVSGSYWVDLKRLPDSPSTEPLPNPSTPVGAGGGSRYGTLRYVGKPKEKTPGGVVYNIQDRQILARVLPVWDNIPGYGLGGWGADFPWGYASGFAYDNDRDGFVVWSGRRDTYFVKRSAVHRVYRAMREVMADDPSLIQRYPNAKGIAPSERQVEGEVDRIVPIQDKFMYLEDLKVFIGLRSGRDKYPFWLYRMPEKPGPDPRWNKIKSEGFDCYDGIAEHRCPSIEPQIKTGQVKLPVKGVYHQPQFIDQKTVIEGPGRLDSSIVGNKAILVVRSGDLTLRNLECTNGGTDGGSAVGCIRGDRDGGDVRLEKVRVAHNNDGILAQVNGTYLIEDSLFEYNGGYHGDAGKAHGVYLFGPGKAIIRRSTIRCGRDQGHLIKSGLPHLVIEDSVLDERGGNCFGSRVIDAYNGGILELRNVKIYTKGGDGNAWDAIGYDYEAREDGAFETNRIVLENVEVICGGATETFIGGRNSLAEAEIVGWESVKLQGCATGVLERASAGRPDRVIR